MKYVDINRRYTEIVAEYMAKGYTINTASMGGSQGETCKIDLTNGTEIIRIMVDTFSDWTANLNGIQIIVGKALDEDVRPHSNSGWNTLWNNRLEIITCEQFFKLGEDRTTGTQYGTKAEAEAAAALHLQRYIAKERVRETTKLTGKAIEIGKRIVRREFGFKRICESDITVSKYNGVYTVGYHNKVYRLH